MRIIYATGNSGKIEQVKNFFQSRKMKLEILSLKDIGFNEEIIEDGKTFEENSDIKATQVKNFCDKNNINEIIVADDAGLCVDCLNGEPGVRSARYAGDHAPQNVVIDKLLNNMKDVPEKERTANFVCVLTAILKDNNKIVVKGETKGKIVKVPGTMGKLTYGPIFMPDGFSKVMNDLTNEELGTTHREKAFVKLIEEIKNIEK